jgi:hypothetical protein
MLPNNVHIAPVLVTTTRCERAHPGGTKES